MKADLFGNARELYEVLIRTARKMRAEPDEAQDLAQESICRLIAHKDGIRDCNHAQAYAIITLRFLKIEQDRLRRKFFTEWDGALDNVIPAPDNPFQAVLLAEVLDAVENLSNKECEAILAFAAGDTPNEIAVAQNDSQGTVLTRLHRARKKLVDAFA